MDNTMKNTFTKVFEEKFHLRILVIRGWGGTMPSN